MSKNSGLTAWLESKALHHKKYHDDILGEQMYSGSRLMLLKTMGAFEVKGERQMMWFEMADKDHRINVVLPGSVVKKFNSAHAAPLHARRHELLSIEEFHWIVLAPPLDAPAAGQPVARKSEPTFGIKVLKLREYGGGGKNAQRGLATLRQGGGKEVKDWIEGLERKFKGEQAFATELNLEKQKTLMGSRMEVEPILRPVQAPSAVEKGKRVDRGEGAAPKKQLGKEFSYSRFKAPDTLGAAISGCAPNVQERLKTAWGIEVPVKAEMDDPQPQASTSKLPPPPAPAPPILAEFRRRSLSPPLVNPRPRPEKLGPPRKLARADSVASAPQPQPPNPRPRPEQLDPPKQLAARTDSSAISAPFRPPRLEEQGAPKSLPSAPQPRPPRPEEQGPPKLPTRLVSPARPATTPRATSPPFSDLEGLTQSIHLKAEQASSPSPQFTELNSSDLRKLEAAEERLANTTAPTFTSSPERVYEWPSSPPRAGAAKEEEEEEEDPSHSLSQPFSTGPAFPSPQAGQRPTDSIHYSQFPQEPISVDVSVLEVTSQVSGQPVGGQGVQGGEEEEGEEERGEHPLSRQESSQGSGRGGKRAWEVAEDEAASSDAVIKEEEMEEIGDLESDEEEEGCVVDVFGVGGGEGRKRARTIYDQDDDNEEREGDPPPSSSSSSQSSDPLRPRPRASAPHINYLATSSPAYSQAATHVSESQPSREVTQVSQPQMEEGASVASTEGSSARKREREQLRTMSGEQEEIEIEEKRVKLAASPHPSSPSKQEQNNAQVPQSSTLAASLPRSQPSVPSNSNSPPFNLTPSQLALFVAQEEAWSRAIELPPMAVVVGPWARGRGAVKG